MAKTDFLGVMIRDVEFNFPRLGATWKFNKSENRSEECSPKANGANYSINWDMTEADARALYKQMKAHYNSCSRPIEFSKVFGMKKNDDGSYRFTAKRGGVNAAGELNKAPTVITGMKKPLEDVDIWSGSRGNIKVTAFPTVDPDNIGGISFLIDVVQVVHAVYGSAGLDDFDEIPDGTSTGGENKPEFDDFASEPDTEVEAKPAAKPKPKPKPAPVVEEEDDFDDEPAPKVVRKKKPAAAAGAAIDEALADWD